MLAPAMVTSVPRFIRQAAVTVKNENATIRVRQRQAQPVGTGLPHGANGDVVQSGRGFRAIQSKLV